MSSNLLQLSNTASQACWQVIFLIASLNVCTSTLHQGLLGIKVRDNLTPEASFPKKYLASAFDEKKYMWLLDVFLNSLQFDYWSCAWLSPLKVKRIPSHQMSLLGFITTIIFSKPLQDWVDRIILILSSCVMLIEFQYSAIYYICCILHPEVCQWPWQIICGCWCRFLPPMSSAVLKIVGHMANVKVDMEKVGWYCYFCTRNVKWCYGEVAAL